MEKARQRELGRAHAPARNIRRLKYNDGLACLGKANRDRKAVWAGAHNNCVSFGEIELGWCWHSRSG
jgi:hypothetical protein